MLDIFEALHADGDEVELPPRRFDMFDDLVVVGTEAESTDDPAPIPGRFRLKTLGIGGPLTRSRTEHCLATSIAREGKRKLQDQRHANVVREVPRDVSEEVSSTMREGHIAIPGMTRKTTMLLGSCSLREGQTTKT